MAGHFIAFEGGEGAGKTTQSQMLADRLSELEIPCLLVREPGGTELGEYLRAYLKSARPLSREAELLLFEAALFAFAWSHWFWLSWAILLFVGMGSIGYISLGTTVLQLSVPQELQGRVMSLWYVSAGFMFIGSLPMALVADLVSWPVALAGGATVCFAFTLWLAILRSTLRRLET